MKTLASMEYDERGAGEVVCLVHAGVFGSWFAPLFGQRELDGFRVIRPIRPGYGGGPAPATGASLADHAAFGEAADLLGVSYNTIVKQPAAGDHSDHRRACR